MSDMLYLGAIWAQQQRHRHSSQEVLVDGVPVRATFSGSNSYTDQNGEKITSSYFRFIFRSLDVPALTRGTTIQHNGDVYEVAYDRKVLVEHNDPFGLDLVVNAVKK